MGEANFRLTCNTLQCFCERCHIPDHFPSSCVPIRPLTSMWSSHLLIAGIEAQLGVSGMGEMSRRCCNGDCHWYKDGVKSMKMAWAWPTLSNLSRSRTEWPKLVSEGLKEIHLVTILPDLRPPPHTAVAPCLRWLDSEKSRKEGYLPRKKKKRKEKKVTVEAYCRQHFIYLPQVYPDV